jgi:hypothetical protein
MTEHPGVRSSHAELKRTSMSSALTTVLVMALGSVAPVRAGVIDNPEDLASPGSLAFTVRVTDSSDPVRAGNIDEFSRSLVGCNRNAMIATDGFRREGSTRSYSRSFPSGLVRHHRYLRNVNSWRPDCKLVPEP